MTLSPQHSKRVKTLRTETSVLVDCVKKSTGASIESVRDFQENLWNSAFNVTAEASYKHWHSILYLFYDMVTFPWEREQQFILRPDIFSNCRQSGKSCLASTLYSYLYLRILVFTALRLLKRFVEMQVPDEEQSSQPREDARERQDRSKLRRSGIPARFRHAVGASSSSSGQISADIHNAAEGHMVISPIHRS
jgi:hypothetical protein